MLLEDVETPPVNAQQIKQWTDKDPVLARVRDYILGGWPREVGNEAFTPYRLFAVGRTSGCPSTGTECFVEAASPRPPGHH